MGQIRKLGLIAGLLLMAGAVAFAQCNGTLVDTSEAEVLPGVILHWESSFACQVDNDSGSYEFTFKVTNKSSQPVEITDIRLFQVTPRPRRSAATGTLTSKSGFPTQIAAGGSASFTVGGTYTLAVTDEGKKANLHFAVDGAGVEAANAGEPFHLGVNLAIRGPGATP